MCDDASKAQAALNAQADRDSDRAAKTEIARIEAPVELVKAILTFAVLIAVILCIGVPLVLLLCGHGIDQADWQARWAYKAILVGVAIVLLLVVWTMILASVFMFKNRCSTTERRTKPTTASCSTSPTSDG